MSVLGRRLDLGLDAAPFPGLRLVQAARWPCRRQHTACLLSLPFAIFSDAGSDVAEAMTDCCAAPGPALMVLLPHAGVRGGGQRDGPAHRAAGHAEWLRRHHHCVPAEGGGRGAAGEGGRAGVRGDGDLPAGKGGAAAGLVSGIFTNYDSF